MVALSDARLLCQTHAQSHNDTHIAHAQSHNDTHIAHAQSHNDTHIAQ